MRARVAAEAARWKTKDAAERARLVAVRERIFDLLCRGWSHPEIAAETGLKRGTAGFHIRAIRDQVMTYLRGHAVPWGLTDEFLERLRVASRKWGVRCTPRQLEEIRRQHRRGVGVGVLSQRYRIHTETIKKIVTTADETSPGPPDPSARAG